MKTTAVLSVLALAACSSALPEAPVQRALVRDLERIVEVRQQVGWFLDEVEMEAILPDVMRSACRVRDGERSEALSWLDQRILRVGCELGGPCGPGAVSPMASVIGAFRASEKRMDRIQDLLMLARARLVLGQADGWARAGRCPFWLEPLDDFPGIQVTARRFILGLEGDGRGIDEFREGRLRYGAGGAGRLLLGYGITERVALFAGLEVGGGALVSELHLGMQSSIPDVVGFAALPLVARYHFGVSAHFEGEVGPMAYITSLNTTPDGRVSGSFEPGVRLGVGLGGSYLRLQRGVMPLFTIGVALDHVSATRDHPAVTQLSVLIRTGISYSRDP